tara:strand:- start:719 stop:1570 length:852 start_codon:yes stop_codon:yes gene_type:complete
MAYIGNQADTAFTSLIKQDLTGASGTSLTLTHAVANANDIALYINNVRQEPVSAYSTNGTAVSLTGSVVSSDDIYVIYLARAVQTTVPPDGSVSTAKIASSAVDLTSKVTGVLPVANGGTGSSSASEINSVIETFYYHTGDITEGNNHDLDLVWTRLTSNGTANKNGGMSASSGHWTFPSTGIWNVTLSFAFYEPDTARNSSGVLIMHSTDSGSNFTATHGGYQNSRASGSHGHIVLTHIFNVTNASTTRILFRISSGGNLSVRGGSDWNTTKLQFIKLCPSV